MSAIVLWLLLKVIKKEEFLLPRSILISYLIFFIFCISSLIYSDLSGWKLGVRGFLKWFQYFGFFCVCAEWFANKPRIYRGLFFFLCSMVLVSANGLYQLATGIDFLRHVSLDPGRITRMKSSLGAPNTLAAFYLFAIPVACAFFANLKKWRAAIAPAILLFCACLILTFSRAAFLSLIFSVLLSLIIYRQWKWLFVMLGTLAGALFLIQPFYQNFFGSLTLKDISVGERLRYWSYTWDMIQAHPFLGNGLNLYLKKLPYFIPAEEIYRGYAHNSYLQMWAEIGFIGLLSFLFPLTRLLVFISQKQVSESLLKVCLSVGCIAFAIQACFDNHFYSMQPAFLFWTFFGIYIGVVNNRPTA